jgi:hypothetical protein
MSSAAGQLKVGRHLRRSKRLGLSVAVQVYGRNAFGEAFREFAQVVSVSAHGGLLALAANVQKGQTILVVNRNTSEEQESRVVHVARAPQGGKWRVGIEFLHTADGFWKVYFPPVSKCDR